ncbi:MAG: hypothetical protein NVS4B6_22610 [Mycobacterium sp.]
MSIVAVAALWTADNERRASRAVRSGGASFYAAEAGLEQQWAGWSNTVAKSLNPGDSVDLGVKPLSNGASYRAVIHRVDNGGTPLYELVSEGRGAGVYQGQSLLNLFVETTVKSNLIVQSAITGTGATNFQAPFSVSGFDSIPPSWGPTTSANCDTTRVNNPGLTWNTGVSPTNISGTPPVVVNPALSPANMFTWGTLTYADLVAMATMTISTTVPIVGPKVIGGACNTSDISNWGDPLDPTSPCYNYFPIIHATTDLQIQSGYGQGILLLDVGSHIGFPVAGFTFYGLIISKGPQTDFHGTVNIFGGIIAANEIQLDGGQHVYYSSCVVNRAMAAAGVGLTTSRLGDRAWNSVLR